MSRYLKIVLANILVLFFVVGGTAIGGFYIYERNQYITTDDARVSANMVTVTALISGKLTAWNVRPGERVSDNSALGSEQTVTGASAGAAGSKTALSTKISQAAPVNPATPSTNQTGTPPAATGTPPAVTTAPSKVDIKAPIEGTIIQSMVEQGQTVMPGQVLLFPFSFLRLDQHCAGWPGVLGLWSASG